jgi:hypothetical protein
MAVFRINVTLLQGFAFSLGNIADCKEVQSVQNFGELQGWHQPINLDNQQIKNHVEGSRKPTATRVTF